MSPAKRRQSSSKARRDLNIKKAELRTFYKTLDQLIGTKVHLAKKKEIRSTIEPWLLNYGLRVTKKDESPAQQCLQAALEHQGGPYTPFLLLYGRRVPWAKFLRKPSDIFPWILLKVLGPISEQLPEYLSSSDMGPLANAYKEARGTPGHSCSKFHLVLEGRDDNLLLAIKAHTFMKRYKPILSAPVGFPRWKTVWKRDRLLRATEELILAAQFESIAFKYGEYLRQYEPISQELALERVKTGGEERAPGQGMTTARSLPRGVAQELQEKQGEVGYLLLRKFAEAIQDLYTDVGEMHVLGMEIYQNRVERMLKAVRDFETKWKPRTVGSLYLGSLLRASGYTLSSEFDERSVYRILASMEAGEPVSDGDPRTETIRKRSKNVREVFKALDIPFPLWDL